MKQDLTIPIAVDSKFFAAVELFANSVDKLGEIMAKPQEGERWLKSGEICKELGITSTTLSRYVAAHPEIRKGRKYSVEKLNFWMGRKGGSRKR